MIYRLVNIETHLHRYMYFDVGGTPRFSIQPHVALGYATSAKAEIMKTKLYRLYGYDRIIIEERQFESGEWTKYCPVVRMVNELTKI